MAKTTNPKKNKHLTQEDRVQIEECLSKSMFFKNIAKLIDKDPTTISYEVKHHRFHRNKAITSLVHDPKAAAKIEGLINEGKIDDMFSFLRMYIDSIDDSEETSNAEELYSYLKNNEDGLLDYRIQEPCLPDCPAGFVYRNLGTMENHNSLIIARRMKHNHTTWSKKGANNMAKILAANSKKSL